MSEGDAPVRARFEELDLMRWVSITAVVLIHVTALSIVGSTRGWLFAVNQAVRFAVPAFVFMAAGLAWTRPPARGGYRHYLLGRAMTVLVPYALVSVLYSAIGFRAAKAGGGWVALVTKLVVDLLTGRAWPHLYFVPIVVTVYVLAPLAARAVSRAPAAWFVVSLAAAAVARAALPGAPVAVVAWGNALLYAPYAFAGGWYVLRHAAAAPRFARAWPYVLAAGAVLAGIRVAVVGTPATAGVVAGSLAGVFVNVSDLVVIVGLLGACTAFADRSPRVAGQATRAHGLVYGVYLMHPLLIYAVAWLASRLGLTPALASPLAIVALTAAILALSVGLVAALARSRFTAWAVGVRGPLPATLGVRDP